MAHRNRADPRFRQLDPVGLEQRPQSGSAVFAQYLAPVSQKHARIGCAFDLQAFCAREHRNCG